MTYYAHSAGARGDCEPNAKHLGEVSRLAGELAAPFEAREEAEFAGLLHDLGKYGERFQRRLQGLESGVDHWTAGAWECLARGKVQGVAAALCVQGHHIGLRQATKDALDFLAPKKWSSTSSEANPDVLVGRFQADGIVATPPRQSLLNWRLLGTEPAAQMLNVRMLFSALTDADYLCTEQHFDGAAAYARRLNPPPLLPQACLASLEKYLRQIEGCSAAPASVREMRRGLYCDCKRAASGPPGVYTLTAPTGTGKTLAMLAFALRHALAHGLRRVVVVIPYLTILEQTVREYRNALAAAYPAELLDSVILEHHSLSGTRGPGEEGDPEAERRRQALTENWNTPFVVTTSVQFLESLFANRPGACRKLHNLAKSVVLMDEVQTIPPRLVVPTLAALSALSSKFGTTLVMATATQPAFEHLGEHVDRLTLAGWRPQEVVGDRDALFERAARTRVEWPTAEARTSWEDLAGLLREQRQALCVVNLKRHAMELFEAAGGGTDDGVFHLSTSMCPAHRSEALSEVRRRLKGKAERCLLISTQCVEAGVDVDFPAVFRAMGPLEAIAQAAGRCNRDGRSQEGVVRVFRPERDERGEYPSKSYELAADVTAILLKEAGETGLSIHDPATFLGYYRRLYGLSRPGEQHKKLRKALDDLDFEAAAREYRLIDKAALNVVVPYRSEIFAGLAQEIRDGWLTKDWISKARPYTVGVFRPAQDAVLWSWLEPVKVTHNEMAEDWFLLRDEELYHPSMGLRAPDGLAWMEA